MDSARPDSPTVPKGRMDAAAKAAWLAALRGGQFVQIRGRLRGDDNGRCCLGVACDVLGAGSWQGRAYLEGDSKIWGMPDTMRERLRIEDLQESILITMNDLERKSFGEIADWIEENL